MSDSELYAYYKRTAPVEDVRFWLKAGRMSAELRDSFNLLLVETINGLPAAEHKRRFTNLKDAWRHERAGDKWPSAETWNRLARFQRRPKPKPEDTGTIELEDDPIGDMDLESVA